MDAKNVLKQIYNDAENVIVKKNRIVEIGTKINKKLANYQFMGILKIKKKISLKCINFINQYEISKLI